MAEIAHFFVRKNGHPGDSCFHSPSIFISQWRHLYSELIWRHSTISGIGESPDLLTAGELLGLPSVSSTR
jgi:hypothetical protein